MIFDISFSRRGCRFSGKVLAAAACLAFSSAFFAGCSASADGSVTELTVWYGPSSSDSPPPPDDWSFIARVREELGIKLTIVPLPSSAADQNEKIEAAVRSRSLPDLFMVTSDELVSLAKRNEIARVDRMYKMMPYRTAHMYDEDAQAASSFDGASYGLSQSGSIARNEGIFIRKDWLDKLNMPVPETLEDYMNVMRRFTTDDPDGNGKNDTFGYGAFIETTVMSGGLGRRLEPFFGAFGVAGTFNMTKENAGLNIYKEGFYDAVEFIQKMVMERVIDPNWLAYGKDDFREAWKNGRFGIMREQNAAFGLERGYKPFDEKFPDGEWILINPPKGPNGLQSVGCYTQGYRTYAVSRRAAELDKLPAIARLLEWMSTDAYYLVAYGEEGVNFMFDSDGKVTTEGLPDPELAYSKTAAAPLIQLRNMVFYNSDSELSARYPEWTTKNGKKISALSILRDMQSRPWTAALGADRLPPPPPELKKMYENGILDFVTGKRSLSRDNWKSFLAEFDRLGGKKWEAECISFAEDNRLLGEAARIDSAR